MQWEPCKECGSTDPGEATDCMTCVSTYFDEEAKLKNRAKRVAGDVVSGVGEVSEDVGTALTKVGGFFRNLGYKISKM